MENEKAQVIDALEAGNEDAFEMDTAGEVHVDLEAGEDLDVQGMDEDDDGEDDDGEYDGNDGDDMEQSDDGEMDMDAASRPGAKASGKSQTAILYSNEGQLNPKKAKQARRQRKKAAKNADADVEMGDDDSDSDFDFTALPAGVASKYELLADTDE